MRALIGISGFLLYLLLARWWFVSEVRQVSAPSFNTTKTAPSFPLYHGVSCLNPAFKPFTLDEKGTVVSGPFNGQLMLELADYADQFPESTLVLSFPNKDSYHSIWEQDGIMEAIGIKEWLTQNEVFSDRIVFQASKKQTAFVTFHLAPSKALESPKTTFFANTFSEQQWKNGLFQPNQGFRQYIDSLQAYVADKPQIWIEISPFSIEQNDQTAQQRVKMVSTYLQSKGIRNSIHAGKSQQSNTYWPSAAFTIYIYRKETP